MDTRNWCFFSFHPERPPLTYNPSTIKYLVFQKIRTQNELPYWTGYVEFIIPKNLNQLNQSQPKVIWNPAKYPTRINIDYCTSNKNRIEGPFSFGEAAKEDEDSEKKGEIPRLTQEDPQRKRKDREFIESTFNTQPKFNCSQYNKPQQKPTSKRNNFYGTWIVGPSDVEKQHMFGI